MGKFNRVINSEIDTSRACSTPPLSKIFIKAWKLLDVWSKRNVNLLDDTYLSPRHNSFSWIDTLFDTERSLENTSSVSIETRLYSGNATVDAVWDLWTHHKFYLTMDNKLLVN